MHSAFALQDQKEGMNAFLARRAPQVHRRVRPKVLIHGAEFADRVPAAKDIPSVKQRVASRKRQGACRCRADEGVRCKRLPQDHDLSRWRVAADGGAPMPQATIDSLARELPNLVLMNVYGATETTSPVTMVTLGETGSRGESVGLPFLALTS